MDIMLLLKFFLFIIGSAVGSFLHVVALRLNKNETIVWGRSHCDYCSHTLSWYELIPLFSFLFQRGVTRCCHRKLSFQHVFVEGITGIGFVLIGSSFLGRDLQLCSVLFECIPSFILLSVFIIIFLSDFKYQTIPMNVVYIGIGAAIIRVLAFLFANCSISYGVQECILIMRPYLLSSVIGFLFFYLIWLFSKGKAMGDGDAPLVFLIGLVGGYPKTLIALYVAFLTGAIVGVILILRKGKTLKSQIAFGPFLIFGLAISLLFGEHIIALWQYLQ